MGSEESYVCPRCGNKDPRYLGMKQGRPYCRKCISFIGAEAESLPSLPKAAPLCLHYALSEEQKRISDHLIANYENGDDTLVYAVCGSGKTEISYGIIGKAMSQGLQVGFAVPRRDVVIELYWRLKEAFPQNRIAAVYGEHTFSLKGDLVILTTHQLYRYPQYFDLLVMDEIDAFPFKGNDVLIAMYKNSLRGHAVMMSATPSKAILAEFQKPHHHIEELRTRFHKQPIPVPLFVERPSILKIPFLLKKLRAYRKAGKPTFVFVPTIALCEDLYAAVRLGAPGGACVHSKREGREAIISAFKKGELSYLVTTSVLERGVTIKNLQVIVYDSDEEKIYDSSALIQIAGRAGRKMDAPTGEVIFLASKISPAMAAAKKEIEFCNTFL